MPFVTRSITSASSGLASSRFGPTFPDAARRLERVAAAAACGREDGLAGRRVARGRAGGLGRRQRLLPGLRALGLRRLGAVRLFLLRREEDHARHRPDEEQGGDDDVEAEPLAGKVRVAAREVEGREQREDDERAGEDAEPELPLRGDREQHGPEPTRARGGRAGPS